ncbi:MAG: mechanosensitive ion channel domain-containing protein, partial [Chitinophagaceae bacterium]
ADDTVKLGTLQGKVERIGFRSTRLRGADGSLLIVPNKKLIDETLENLSERDKRKVRLVIPLSTKRKADDLNNLLPSIKNSVESLTRVLDGATVTIDSFAADTVQILVVYQLPGALADEQIQSVISGVNLKVYELVAATTE